MAQWFSDAYRGSKEGKAAEECFFECFPYPFDYDTSIGWKQTRKDEHEQFDLESGKTKMVKDSPLKFKIYDVFREQILSRYGFDNNPHTQPAKFRQELKDNFDGKTFELRVSRPLKDWRRNGQVVSRVYTAPEKPPSNPSPTLSFLLTLKWLCPCMR